MTVPPHALGEYTSYHAMARAQARPPLLRRARPGAYELLAALLLFVPFPLWSLAGGPAWGSLPLLLALLASAVVGMLLRRMPNPVPSISTLPAGTVWIVAVLGLLGGAPGLTCALLVGLVLLFHTSVPAPGELPPLLGAVIAQAAVPALGGALSLLIAISLLGVQAPIYAVALVPTLGGLALAVYLFSREEPVGGGEERPEVEAEG
ncbi:MAG: hypothetical protein KGJ23_11780 [Euryarchaeota archaeon]|nr:hypothetical protein [Euryarchaeota archaeon]MDE1837275.1 hypothetical protein [Euryarchaeota archaeon]MDE1879945.1 hypothetical protein [Euryarchaeota archaeon]MDE2045121.1 hypothetical protein [Thermoplasmata archaeon]